MFRDGDSAVPLAEGSPGCELEQSSRSIQNNTNPRYFYVTLNRSWLRQLSICEQGAATIHSLATVPVEIRHPAIIIQPAEVLEL